MTDQFIVGGLGVIVTLIAVITPIIKLNTNIVRLTTVVEQLEKLVTEKTDKLDERVTTHGKEIDDLKLQQANHEARIKQLEEE